LIILAHLLKYCSSAIQGRATVMNFVSPEILKQLTKSGSTMAPQALMGRSESRGPPMRGNPNYRGGPPRGN
jgi:hypothetical protein